MNKFLSQSWAISLRDLRKKLKWWKYLISIFFLFTIIYFIGFGVDSFFNFSKYNSFNISYSEFFSIALILYLISLSCFISGIELVSSRKGFLKLLLIAPISKFSILIGKTIATIINFVLSYFIIIITFLFIFNKFSFATLLLLFLIFIYSIISFQAFGIWISSYFKKYETAKAFSSYLALLMLFFSGVLFPLDFLGNKILFIYYINPLTYFIDLLRYSIFNSGSLNIYLDIVFVLIFGIISIILGTYYYNKRIRR